MKEDDLFLWKFGQMSRSRAYSAAAKGKGGISMSAEYAAVMAAMPTAPSSADQAIQATMLDALVTGGYYAKAEILDIFATHTGGSLINWRNPGTFNPSVVNTPTFIEYEGYTGIPASTSYVRTNFTPATNATVMTQNSQSFIIGVGTNTAQDGRDFGAGGTGYGLRFFIQTRPVSSTPAVACGSASYDSYTDTVISTSVGHWGATRGAAADYSLYINKTRKGYARNSVALCDQELYVCNANGWSVSDKQIRYAFVFSYLTEAEVGAVIDIMETYLDAYGKGLIA